MRGGWEINYIARTAVPTDSIFVIMKKYNDEKNNRFEKLCRSIETNKHFYFSQHERDS